MKKIIFLSLIGLMFLIGCSDKTEEPKDEKVKATDILDDR